VQSGCTALTLACYSGNVDVVQYLVETLGADMHKVHVASGTSVFMEACHGGNLDVAAYLADQGADVSAVDASGRSALSITCSATNSMDQLALVQYLVQSLGADVNGIDHLGFTPIAVAVVAKGKRSIVKFLVEHGADVATADGGAREHLGGSLFAFACLEGCDTGVVKILAESGHVDVNAPSNESALTAFARVCASGDLRMARFLVDELNVDRERTYANGKSPFFITACKGDLLLAKYLVGELGIDLTTDLDPYNTSPFAILLMAGPVYGVDYSVAMGRFAIMRYLIEAKKLRPTLAHATGAVGWFDQNPSACTLHRWIYSPDPDSLVELQLGLTEQLIVGAVGRTVDPTARARVHVDVMAEPILLEIGMDLTDARPPLLAYLELYLSAPLVFATQRLALAKSLLPAPLAPSATGFLRGAEDLISMIVERMGDYTGSISALWPRVEAGELTVGALRAGPPVLRQATCSRASCRVCNVVNVENWR
jgi:hypothetical protein